MSNTAEALSQHNIAVRVFQPPSARDLVRPKILLLKLDHIGDFITALSAFRLMRTAFADAEMTLICLPSVVDLAKGTGLFDIVRGMAAIPDSALVRKVAQKSSDARIAELQALLEGPYLLAADFKHDPYDRFGLDHVDALYRAAFAASMEKRLDITLPTTEWDVPLPEVQDGQTGGIPLSSGSRMMVLAQAIIDALVGPPSVRDLFVAAPEVTQSAAYRGLASVEGLKVGISLGAGAELRKWDMDYWALLTERLVLEHCAHLVFFGGDGDRAETQWVMSRLPIGSYTNLTGVLPLHLSPYYLQLLHAYIGCDTGLTHLAAGLDLPTVNIYAGISNISVWRARGAKVRTVYAEVVCAPCHKRLKVECPNNNICMAALSPEIVLTCFRQVLSH